MHFRPSWVPDSGSAAERSHPIYPRRYCRPSTGGTRYMSHARYNRYLAIKRRFLYAIFQTNSQSTDERSAWVYRPKSTLRLFRSHPGREHHHDTRATLLGVHLYTSPVTPTIIIITL